MKDTQPFRDNHLLQNSKEVETLGYKTYSSYFTQTHNDRTLERSAITN